jgi:hypothetical protein
MFLDLRIVKELRVDFSEVRILQGLPFEWRFVERCQSRRAVYQAFELLFGTTRRRVTYQ